MSEHICKHCPQCQREAVERAEESLQIMCDLAMFIISYVPYFAVFIIGMAIGAGGHRCGG